jgi:acyl dehydratase
MALDKRFIGRKYGPYGYEAGVEKMREFALAVGGGIPSTGFSAQPAPATLHPWLHDREAARGSKYGGLVAMPNFAVTFAIAPFASACSDPELGVNLLMLVHGEQEFEFFKPVRSGDVLTTTGEIADIYSKKGLDFLVVTSHTVDGAGEPVVDGRWGAVIRSS